MDNVINLELFRPLVPYITLFEYPNKVGFRLPKSFIIDHEAALAYFESDAAMEFTRNQGRDGFYDFSGTLKDPKIFKFFMQEYYEHGPQI